MGPYTGNGVPVDGTTGLMKDTFPQINGGVYSVVSDGSDGVYVGGQFTQVGSFTISNLAHILSDGSVDSTWTPNPNARVWTSTALPGNSGYYEWHGYHLESYSQSAG